jgi:hypothetical protein
MGPVWRGFTSDQVCSGETFVPSFWGSAANPRAGPQAAAGAELTPR